MPSLISNSTYIFFDTNILENRFNNDCLQVSQPKFSALYYSVKNFIINEKIQDFVKICIPEIVFVEMKKHLIDCYKSKSDSLKSHVETYKKVFGDMYEISTNKKICQTYKDYTEYIDKYFDDILNKNSDFISIIPYPRNNEIFEKIIHKAIHSEKPFTKVKGNGKEYTDAGLKDAIIYETLLQYSVDKFCILVSKDNDFKCLFENETETENIKLCNDENSLMKILLSRINISALNYKIEILLSENEYFRKTILSEVKFDEFANFKFDKIINVKEVDSGTEIIFSAVINGEKYEFDVIYEMNANELVEVVNFTGENDE